MFHLKSNLNNLSRVHLTYISLIAILVFLGVARLSYAAITIGLTTVTSDGSLSSVSTGDFIFSTTVSNGDTLKLVPATGGAGTFAGTLTSSDLTANRTWTFPNESGTIALAGGTTPGFLAYRSADNTVNSGATIEFDTEVYDTSSNFSSSVFTAPSTGIYQLCAVVIVHDTQVELSYLNPPVRLVTSNRSYHLGIHHDTLGAGMLSSQSGCIFADMDANDTAYLIQSSLISLEILGSNSPYKTYFSGRLMD